MLTRRKLTEAARAARRREPGGEARLRLLLSMLSPWQQAAVGQRLAALRSRSPLAGAITEAKSERAEGEEWQSGGRWYRREGGRTVRFTKDEDWQKVRTRGGKEAWRSASGRTYYGPKPGTQEYRAERERREKELARKELGSLKEPAVGFASAYNSAATTAYVSEVIPGGVEVVPKLIGALGGSRVSVDVAPHWDRAKKQIQIKVNVEHPAVRDQVRTIGVGEDGTTVCHNDLFFLKKRHMGGGLGMKVFSDQVRAMADAGVDAIETTAGKGGGMNGYYTWPRLGYDADLDEDYLKKLPRRGVAALVRGGMEEGEARRRVQAVLSAGPKTVLDLMDSEDGRAIWKATGYQAEMRFDLRPGSRSLGVLNAYLASKGRPPIVPDAEGAAAAREARRRVAANAAEKARAGLRARREQEEQARVRAALASGSPPPIPEGRTAEFREKYQKVAERLAAAGLSADELSRLPEETRETMRSLASSPLESSRAVAADPVALRVRAAEAIFWRAVLARHQQRMGSPRAEQILRDEFAGEAEKLGVGLQELYDEARQHGASNTSADAAAGIRGAINSALYNLKVRARMRSA